MSDQLPDLIGAARALVVPGERRFLGVTGAPGAGKTTLAVALVAALAPDAVLVEMDGFHLSNDELARLGRPERKGAIDTFDAAGYLHLLRRLHAREDRIVYAPRFNRTLEESIGSAVPIPTATPLIITEGNYLLAEGPDWGSVRGLLDECWYVEPGEDLRLSWLVARHMTFGRSVEEAQQRSYGPDHRNADLIASTRYRASRIVQLAPSTG